MTVYQVQAKPKGKGHWASVSNWTADKVFAQKQAEIFRYEHPRQTTRIVTGTKRNPSARSTRKRVSRALTKYVRNFTGTITRTGDGQVVIAGTGPKPKTAKNPKRGGNWQVIHRGSVVAEAATKAKTTAIAKRWAGFGGKSASVRKKR